MASAIHKKTSCYSIKIDPENGTIKEFIDLKGKYHENLVSCVENRVFGRIFRRNEEKDEYVSLSLKNISFDNSLDFSDETGKNCVSYILNESNIEINFTVDSGNNLRTGIELDLNFINTPGLKKGDDMVIPTSPNMEEGGEQGFYLMSRTSGRYIVLAFPRPFACWRLKYSNFGHHLLGFQLLLSLSDMKYPEGTVLNAYNSSSVRIGFAEDLEEAYTLASRLGGFPVVHAPFFGGTGRIKIPLTIAGEADELLLIDPHKKKEKIEISGNKGEKINIELRVPGQYTLLAKKDAQVSKSTFFRNIDWESLIKRTVDFGVSHFQLPEGCYARAIDATNLAYRNMKVIGGYSFGDPYEEHSCGSGEFGGFLAWLTVKRMLHFGETEDLIASSKKYFYSWALQNGAGSNSFFLNAISPVTQQNMGETFSQGHLFKDQLYIQYEGWFLEEFCDYFQLTKDQSLLNKIKLIAFHMIDEHQDENGALINISSHNDGIFQKVDYTSCGTPVIGLIKAGRLLMEEGLDREKKVLSGAEKACNHLVKRGFNFPTETLPDVEFVEEGSMACTALSLIYAYLHVAANENYKKMAGAILQAHDDWIIRSPQASLYGSSFRYWENIWETKDWGPSINGGHAWSIWTAEAWYYHYFISGDFSDLIESFAGFISNLSKVNQDGSMYSNYTPDFIPGDFSHNGSQFTTKYLAHGFPKRTFVSSSAYFLIRGSETWLRTSAIGLWKGELISLNGFLDDKSNFISHAPRFKILALDNGIGRIEMQHEGELEIIKSSSVKEMKVLKGTVLSEDALKIKVKAVSNRITIFA
ncbi:MAG: hypothetical protein KAU17_09575 [Spirochaetales bacterium]|nr:hypothetical protein [Spirochaetales bacterium]